jgi:phosphomannomutase
MKKKPVQLVVFDLDGTLAASKSSLKKDMAKTLEKLLTKKKVAVIGGGTYEQFQGQLVANLKISPSLLQKLFLFPKTSTSFYRYDGRWKQVYGRVLSAMERKKIKKAFQETFEEVGYRHPKKTYGPVIEDRGSQVTFSALGQQIVQRLGAKGVALKEQWKKENNPLRMKMAKIIAKKLPGLEVHTGGLTSIDVTERGIDKAYGVRQIKKTLHIPISEMIFIGDALYPGGNDYAAKRTGVECIKTKGPDDTKRIIEKIMDSGR